MVNEETVAKIMRALSVAFPVLFCILLGLLIHAVNSVGSELKAAAAVSAKGPQLPAGIYICDGDKCVIANSSNIDGIGKSK